MAKDKRFSETIQCGHCGNKAPMEVGETYSQVQSDEDERSGHQWECGPVFELLACPACQGVTLRSYYWHDGYGPEDIAYDYLYPSAGALTPKGLPAPIQREFDAAQRVRAISANAYGVLIGRLLELVCEDRGAKGRSLHARLTALSKQDEIPQQLVSIADKIRQFRNVGAHAGEAELSTAEVRILDSLCRAVLEYVYSAPHMVDQAQGLLDKLTPPESEDDAPEAEAE